MRRSRYEFMRLRTFHRPASNEEVSSMDNHLQTCHRRRFDEARENPGDSIQLTRLSGTLVVFVIGLSVAFCAFAVEIVQRYFRSRTLHSRQFAQ